MVGKRGPSDMSPPKSGGKRQQTLKSSFQNASKPRRAPVEQQVQPQLLNQEHVHQLEQAVESYCLSWGQKCKQDSNYNIGGAARDDVDLDGRGMLVVRAFTDALELATARSEMLEPRFLESLVLVLRNDAVHQHSHVSRAAYMALMSYFAAHPGAKAKEYPADGEAVGQPYVVLNTQAVWTPLATDRQSFTSKYLLSSDMSIAGRNWHAEKDSSLTSRRLKDSKFASPLELFLHCAEKGEKAAQFDFNGDLQLWDYLLAVYEQDLAARLSVHEKLGEAAKRGEVDDETARQRKALLENSFAWRTFADNSVGLEKQELLLAALVRLIVAGKADAVADLAAAEEEPEDDAPAGACVFTHQELAALAARVLGLMMRLFGAAEGAGAFLATGKHRSSTANYRMKLDAMLVKLIGNDDIATGRPESLRALLCSLAPRDALRLLSLHAASKFAKTYGADASDLGSFSRVVGDLTVLHEVHGMLSRGSDLKAFYEVNVIPVLASLHREPARAVKAYGSVNHLAVVLGGLAAAMHALVARGEEVSTGPGGMAAAKEELAAALRAVAAQSREGKDSSCELSRCGMCELITGQMTMMALPGTA